MTIIGTGLLGASIGLALKQRGLCQSVVGLGRRAATLEQALSVGAIDRWTTDYQEALAESDLAIVAVPLSAFDAVFDQIAAHGPDNLIVTDVGSTKASVHAAAHHRLKPTQRFIGSHPMAGSEHQGPQAARADLFVGKPCIVTDGQAADPEAGALVGNLWQTLGMSVIAMSADDHDAQSAVVSHLPHAASVMLIQTATKLGGWEIASTGFEDTTRLASSNPPMRADILLDNREQLSHALSVFRDQLDELTRLLDAGDRAAILQRLEDSRAARQTWQSKVGPSPKS